MNVVITGATKGIGKALAVRFCQEGFNIAICSRNKKDLEDTKKELAAINNKAVILIKMADVSIKEEVISFGKFVIENFDKVDVLINNAGVFTPGEILSEPDGVLEKTMDTNLYSAYHLSRYLLPAMIPNKSGHIFNICSIASFMAYPNGGSYSISKFALLGFSKVLREELKGKGIKVTSVMPGATWSASWEGADFPHERLMIPEDVAETIWTASNLSPQTVVEEILLRPQLGDL